jgi:FAD/FMN-containing dehydrogenase
MAPTIDRFAPTLLRGSLRGTALTPGETGYDEARQPWNLNVDQRPALVALVVGAADVVACVAFAREQALPLAVQSTGHGIAYPCDGGLLVNTSRLGGVRVDPESRTARAEAGAVWRDVVHEAQAFGLAPLSGFAPYVGVAGYTLGGGVGWLVRKHGFAADSLVAADIVTADGRLLRASEAERPDLFWGLKGGGGNFGIVTSLEVRLYPVTTVYGGALFYPVEQAGDVLRRYARWVETVPDELTSTVAFMHLPPAPDLPEVLRSRSVVVVRACYLGAEQAGAELLRPLRQADPVVDTFAMLPYRDAGAINGDPVDPQGPYGHVELLRRLSDGAIDTLVELAGARSNASLLMLELRHLGGAAARVPVDASAISHRDAPFVMHLESLVNIPEGAARVQEYTASVAAAMRPFATGGTLIAFLGDGDVGYDRVRAAYSDEHWRRLVALKDRYDPGNFFRLNHNVPPSWAGHATPAENQAGSRGGK